MEQRSTEWFQARCGKATASRIADAIAKTKTGWGAGRTNYMAELIAERLTGCPAERFSNAAMQWGTDTEGEARTAYSLATGEDVIEVGFIDHPQIPMTGASPDGFVGDDGLVEIKCPNTATHIETLICQTIPAKYETQMLWQMACTGRKWCDFVSYDPRMPANMRLFVSRFHLVRDDLAAIENAVCVFLAEVNAKHSQLLSAVMARAA